MKISNSLDQVRIKAFSATTISKLEEDIDKFLAGFGGKFKLLFVTQSRGGNDITPKIEVLIFYRLEL